MRKGTPDSGVECYVELAEGGEWAWQAKYIDSFSNRWAQIDSSVRKALDGHPALTRYYVCVPFDLPDGRKEDQTSARGAWEKHVATWRLWAAERNMAVEYVLWGASELVDRLTRPENVGLVRYWFDTSAFDPNWFRARLDDSLRAAGPRYTPEAHVDLPISDAFEALGRTPAFFQRFRSRTRELRKAQRRAQVSPAPKPSVGGRAPKPDVYVWDDDAHALSDAAQNTIEVVVQDTLNLRGDPSGSPGFGKLVNAIDVALQAVEAFTDHLRELYAGREGRPGPGEALHDALDAAYELRSHLGEFLDAVEGGRALASAEPMIVRGTAGTGKTHLLCDVARARVEAGFPTVLLMGQRFLGTEEPWTQALRQLDMPGVSAREFVGALEAAAEASGVRALVLIDALNEGAGKAIWPAHLAAFLAVLDRSEWVSVCLTVRSSYERIVIPETVRSGAVTRTHRGFSDHEYDAVATFFDHYGVERPSAPLLSPEFQNPLFLKTLCVGIRREGRVVRLPRGFHGVTRVFDLYLSAVNKTLSRNLDYAERRSLVEKAVHAIAVRLGVGSDRWVGIEEAERLLDPLLPDRDDDRSLLTGLLREGVLISEGGYTEDGPVETIQIAFDRLADYRIANLLVGEHDSVDRLLAEGKLTDALSQPYVRPGLAEALCVRLPEAIGVELSDAVPSVLGRWFFGEAFRKSVVWRALDAFTNRTVEILDETTHGEDDEWAVMETVLTVATLPDHPLNAAHLHTRLLSMPLAERDAWWSTFLHDAWGQTGSAARRLVNWSWREGSGDGLDNEGIDLTATALGWTLTSSNRFLRDSATKALVALLTDRLDAVERFAERFAEVDDPYVAERVYAVAYGCALRSHDTEAVGRLAQAVYDRVFREGDPPPHILLRDYARGVVERSLYLDSAQLDVDPVRIRPPYRSTWPHIPTPEEIEPFKRDWSETPYDGANPGWSRNRISGSVFDDDFGHYVIGSRLNWLSIRLDEPRWMSSGDRLDALRESLTPDQTEALDAFEVAERALARLDNPFLGVRVQIMSADGEVLSSGEAPQAPEPPDAAERAALRSALDIAIDELASLVPLNTLNEFADLRDEPREEAPSLDRGVVQRYVVWRAFDLGWTTELHGGFDRNVIGYSGRTASKAERIGKKYQWIGYHEILSYLADHFQYREEFGDGGREYAGPWQGSIRDIDPSCTLRSVEGGTGWGHHEATWWASPVIEDWATPERHEEWFVATDDLPDIRSILAPRDPSGTAWASLDAYLTWKEPSPPDDDSWDIGVRELWHIVHGYVMRAEDVAPFMEWADGVNFYGRWMPKPATTHEVFLGEATWPSPAASYFAHPYFGGGEWHRPERGCPVDVMNAVTEYASESSGFDCSVEEGYQLRLPSQPVVDALGLRWTGRGADFADEGGMVCAQDPIVYENGANACLVRRNTLVDALARNGLGICWTLVGEKRFLNTVGRGEGVTDPLMGHISGVYTFGSEGLVGATTVYAERRGADNDNRVVSDFIARITLQAASGNASP